MTANVMGTERRQRQALALAVAFLAAAILAIVTGVRLNAYRSTPVHIPLRDGTVEIPFTVDVNGIYALELELGRGTLAPETLLSAAESGPPKPLFIDLDWQLTRDGAVLAVGSSREQPAATYGSATIGRTLGSFQARRDGRYALDLTIRNFPQQIARARPAIRVQISPRQAMNRTASSVVTVGLGLVLAVIAAAFLRSAMQRRSDLINE